MRTGRTIATRRAVHCDSGPVASITLQVIKKGEEDGRVEVGQRQRRDRLPCAALHVAQEKAKRVAVARDRARTGVALGEQVLAEEVLEELSKRESRRA